MRADPTDSQSMTSYLSSLSPSQTAEWGHVLACRPCCLFWAWPPKSGVWTRTTPMSAATGRGEHYPLVFTTAHWMLDLKDSLVWCSSTSSKDRHCRSWNFFNVSATRTPKVPDLFSKSIQQYRSHTAQVARLREMGGAAASNEIRREIDQCTLIPINHDSHRAWIIISCAGQCHLWEISRNNFCPQCKGEERKLWRYIIWIIAWPRWGYLGIVGPPRWHRNEFLKWGVFMAVRSPISSNCLWLHISLTWIN